MDTIGALRYYEGVSARERIEAKEVEQFAAEMLQHVDHLHRVAFHLAKDRDRANDYVQETYLRALKFHKQFKSGTNLKGWLTTILHNFFIDSYNHTKRIIPMESFLGEAAASPFYWDIPPATDLEPELQLLKCELNTQISDALRDLPIEFSAPVVLVDMSDFSYAEAAEILDCPIGTVRSRLSRGRRMLYRQLKAYVQPK